MWLYAGTPITRAPLVRLFASILKRDETGHYWLETPYERGRITVDDVPFLAVDLQKEDNILKFKTNIDEWVTLSPHHPLRMKFDPVTKEPLPYIHIKNKLDARITRAVYYDLAALAVPAVDNPRVMGVWSQEQFYPLGETGT